MSTALISDETMSVFFEERKTQRRQHRWKYSETQTLLQFIKEAVCEHQTAFEQPTAQAFYTRYCQKEEIKDVSWNIMRHKMRHLKASYIKARNWKDQVGAELFNSDKELIEVRVTNICPFYSLLDSIFGSLVSDPIRIDPSKANGRNMILPDANEPFDDSLDNFMEDDFNDEDTETEVRSADGFVTLKRENTDDDIPDELEIPMPKVSKRVNVLEIPRKGKREKRLSKEAVNEYRLRKLKIDIDRARLELDRRKLNLDSQYRCEENNLMHRRLQFEKEKLDLEKKNSSEDQLLRKYEIDKQFEIKKMEIEKNERLMRLELEYKFKFKMGNDSGVYE